MNGHRNEMYCSTGTVIGRVTGFDHTGFLAYAGRSPPTGSSTS